MALKSIHFRPFNIFEKLLILQLIKPKPFHLRDWLISHSFLGFGPKSSWSSLRHFCITTKGQLKPHVLAHYDLTRYLIRDLHCYLMVTEYGRCSKLSHRNECTEELGIRVMIHDYWLSKLTRFCSSHFSTPNVLTPPGESLCTPLVMPADYIFPSLYIF